MLKIKYGKAFIDPNVEIDENKTYTLDNKCSIQAILLEDIVEARINEILDNVLNQIVLSSYDNKLMAGAILTGGGANLNLMKEAFKARTKIEKVKIAKETQISLKGIEVKKDGSSNTLIALLAAGKENCCLIMPETPAVKHEAPKKTATIIERQLFTEDGRSTIEVEEEEELKRQEEKEKIMAAKKAEKEEEELKKRKKSECEDLIQAAVKLKNEKKFKEGLKQLAKAKEMHIPEKEEAINALEEELKKLKEENSLLNTWMKKFTTLIDED